MYFAHAYTARTIAKIFMSPRKRVNKTFHLLFQSADGVVQPEATEDVAEWNYGKYEGLTTAEIKCAPSLGLGRYPRRLPRLTRQKHDPQWNIWTKGCPDGETPDAITKRVDKVVKQVHDFQLDYWRRVQAGEVNDSMPGGDVVIISHGHFSKCRCLWERASMSPCSALPHRGVG
jgi:broad specificity phosphatase PhoE